MGVELLLTWNYCTLWAAYDTVTVQYVTTVNVKFITSGPPSTSQCVLCLL